MASTLKILGIGHVGSSDPIDCNCPSCAASAPRAAGEAPPSIDFAKAVRESRSEGQAPKPAPAINKNQAPASIDFVEAVKQQRGGQ